MVAGLVNSRLRFVGRSEREKKGRTSKVLKMLMILGTDGGQDRKGSKVTRD